MTTFIDRAAGIGNTQTLIIYECMQRYPDFNWEHLNTILPGQLVAAKAVYRYVLGIRYTFFFADAARPALGGYQQIAKFCWEMLIKGGKSSLEQYCGFQNVDIMHWPALRWILDD